MVQYIIDRAPQGSELASACQLLRYSHEDENMHPDKFTFERFKTRLVEHRVAPQGHVLLLNAVAEYDSVCRKYHEKIPLWFARYDRAKKMLLDRCPTNQFVDELEAHKLFEHSGFDFKEQFKKMGTSWKEVGS